MTRKLIISALIALPIFMSITIGCDKKAATNSNFEDGLNHNFKTHRECLLYAVFPLSGSGRDTKELEALAGVGLLSKSPDPHYHGQYFLYSLTPEGTKASDVPEVSGLTRAACYATKKVTEILNFTEPSDQQLGSGKVSVVTYTLKYTDVASWMNDPAVVAVESSTEDLLKKADDDPSHKAQETMILTHRGWRTAQDQ